jgi:hypothetical protein
MRKLSVSMGISLIEKALSVLKVKKANVDCPLDLRLLKILDPIKKLKLQFITNKFDLYPATFADIYRKRWVVELYQMHLESFIIKWFLGVWKEPSVFRFINPK